MTSLSFVNVVDEDAFDAVGNRFRFDGVVEDSDVTFEDNGVGVLIVVILVDMEEVELLLFLRGEP